MAPAPSKAAKHFTDSQARILALSALDHELTHNHNPKHACAGEVLRGAVVLSVASMDRYFTRRFAELLVPFLKKRGPNDRLSRLLESAGLNTHTSLQLVAMDRPFRRIRALVEAYLARYTTQRFQAIDELFLGLGVKDLSKHAAGSAQRKQLLRSVELLVERRHAIVHDGDLNKHGRLVAIDGPQMQKRFKDLATFVRHADELITRAVKV